MSAVVQPTPQHKQYGARSHSTYDHVAYMYSVTPPQRSSLSGMLSISIRTSSPDSLGRLILVSEPSCLRNDNTATKVDYSIIKQEFRHARPRGLQYRATTTASNQQNAEARVEVERGRASQQRGPTLGRDVAKSEAQWLRTPLSSPRTRAHQSRSRVTQDIDKADSCVDSESKQPQDIDTHNVYTNDKLLLWTGPKVRTSLARDQTHPQAAISVDDPSCIDMQRLPLKEISKLDSNFHLGDVAGQPTGKENRPPTGDDPDSKEKATADIVDRYDIDLTSYLRASTASVPGITPRFSARNQSVITPSKTPAKPLDTKASLVKATVRQHTDFVGIVSRLIPAATTPVGALQLKSPCSSTSARFI